MKNHFPQKYFLNSALEAFLAKSETIISSKVKIYKIGFIEEENPMAIKTGDLSSLVVISSIAESGSKNTSSSSFGDLIPTDCNWTKDRLAEWLKVKFKSMNNHYFKSIFETQRNPPKRNPQQQGLKLRLLTV